MGKAQGWDAAFEADDIEEPVILEPAHRHGVAEEDILHALRFELHHVVQEDGMVMFVGPDQQGVLIEVGVLEWFGLLAVAHAMRPAREKYLRRRK
ncbi:hypothetical protein [Promicromonospora sp. MEB111]|uniref:hypothetical protein n=1 Tax=unclassified Promicromonospora TaxID=2647929 RepID=UPI00254B14B8|nr:hypothetical protein [Promicromonospora sp. MEB111]